MPEKRRTEWNTNEYDLSTLNQPQGASLTELREETHRLATIYERKLAALDDLKKSLLHRALH